ncbi:MAG TPA: flagellar biosynthesis anti-sigma factor FlgM [Candidatus Aquilonibacter sp.]|nr:flagellar biosynthesis anti-sigma factor FlgM [Candidatus Aquilonibacter sp.]
MRINPNLQPPDGVQQDAIQDPKSTAAQKITEETSSAATSNGVQVQLSTSSGQVAALAQQAASVPSVRTDRVDALRKAIRDGNYDVTNEQVAAAMYSDMSVSGTNE